jgi:hypothetical protein
MQGFRMRLIEKDPCNIEIHKKDRLPTAVLIRSLRGKIEHGSYVNTGAALTELPETVRKHLHTLSDRTGRKVVRDGKITQFGYWLAEVWPYDDNETMSRHRDYVRRYPKLVARLLAGQKPYKACEGLDVSSQTAYKVRHSAGALLAADAD